MTNLCPFEAIPGDACLEESPDLSNNPDDSDEDKNVTVYH